MIDYVVVNRPLPPTLFAFLFKKKIMGWFDSFFPTYCTFHQLVAQAFWGQYYLRSKQSINSSKSKGAKKREKVPGDQSGEGLVGTLFRKRKSGQEKEEWEQQASCQRVLRSVLAYSQLSRLEINRGQSQPQNTAQRSAAHTPASPRLTPPHHLLILQCLGLRA